MKRIILLILLSMQMTLSGQSNLVINHSLEDWNDQIPENWRIVANSVDLFKRNYKLIPYGVKCSEYKFRSKFPSKGSHGISYLGLAGNEIISCALRCPLDTKTIYELSFYVYNPPIYSDRKTNKFTVRFDQIGGKESRCLNELRQIATIESIVTVVQIRIGL